jgi:hypothetical protein
MKNRVFVGQPILAAAVFQRHDAQGLWIEPETLILRFAAV